MSSPSPDSLLDKITELYREFQQMLNKISHEHLEESKELLEKIDQAHEEELRKSIQQQ